MIRVRNLEKTFRVHKKEPGLAGSLRALFKREWVLKHALRGVSLDVGEGEIVGLVGQNGAGKTTLVKILSGIIHPDAGEVDVLGFRPWERNNAFRSRIALIMGQKAQLWWDLPAADCFLLLKEIYQIPDDRYQRNLRALSDALRVGDQLHIQIRRLSLGERMKMELIAALLHEPRVVFLDEPTIGLDLGAQRAIRDFLLEYRRTHRPAMILTSHYMEDIERLCKRIVVIREGAVVYDGSLERVVSRYARHKILTARLSGGSVPTRIPARVGRVLERGRGYLKLAVPREAAAESARFVLDRLPVIDLNVEEPEIEAVIEAIMSEEGRS